jgi:hypothetical protein
MNRRTFRLGALGWIAPGIVALPFAAMSEAAGGESALAAVIVWWGLGVVGCVVAGVMVGAGIQAKGRVADAFWSGLAGVSTAWIAAVAVTVAIEIFVRVLHLGAVTFLLPVPFVLGYGVGFAFVVLFRKPGGATIEANGAESPESKLTASGSARPSSLLRRHSRLVALVLGLAIGAAIGTYVHRWWGAGLFMPSTIVSALALLLLGLVVVLTIVEAVRNHEGRAATSLTLGAALVGGTLAGVALGPAYQPAANFAGTVSVHATAPVTADWSGQGYCRTNENSSEVSSLRIVTWSGPGSPKDGFLGFIIDSGAPAFRFGGEGNYYDFFGFPRPRIEVREIGPLRLAGDVAFSGLPTNGAGLLAAFPGQPLDGHVSWSCDPTRPSSY